jgi:hypothetical protein
MDPHPNLPPPGGGRGKNIVPAYVRIAARPWFDGLTTNGEGYNSRSFAVLRMTSLEDDGPPSQPSPSGRGKGQNLWRRTFNRSW